MNAETGSWGKSVESTTATPEVPPKARWLGVLKTTMANAVRIRPRLSMPKNGSFP